MRRRILRLELIACLLAVLGAAGHAPESFGPTDAITVAGLERHLRFIASDELEGRDALSPGFRTAAGYVAATLTRIGATPAGDAGSIFPARGDSPDLPQSAAGRRHARRTRIPVRRRLRGVRSGPRHRGDGLRRKRLAGSSDAGPVCPESMSPIGCWWWCLAGPARFLGGLVRGSDYTTASDNAAALGAAGVVGLLRRRSSGTGTGTAARRAAERSPSIG